MVAHACNSSAGEEKTRGFSRACWLTSPAKSVNSGFSKEPCIKNQVRKRLRRTLASPLCTHAHVCTYTYKHTCTHITQTQTQKRDYYLSFPQDSDIPPQKWLSVEYLRTQSNPDKWMLTVMSWNFLSLFDKHQKVAEILFTKWNYENAIYFI